MGVVLAVCEMCGRHAIDPIKNPDEAASQWDTIDGPYDMLDLVVVTPEHVGIVIRRDNVLHAIPMRGTIVDHIDVLKPIFGYRWKN